MQEQFLVLIRLLYRASVIDFEESVPRRAFEENKHSDSQQKNMITHKKTLELCVDKTTFGGVGT